MASSLVREEPAGRPLFAKAVVTPDQLCHGDHILYKVVEEPYRPVYESAFVAETSEGKLLLFRNSQNGVMKEWVDISALNHLQVVVYTFCRYTNKEAIERASQRLDWGKNEYNALLNNSHHFVTWAKTGKEFPLQDVIKTITKEEELKANGEAPDPLDPVLAKSKVNSLEEIKPGDHVMIPTITGGWNHLIINDVNQEKGEFTGYSGKDKKICSKVDKNPFRIDYIDCQVLYSPEESLERAQSDSPDVSGSDQFVTWFKTGTKYSISDKCLISGESRPVSLTQVSPEIAIDIGDHLIVKNDKGGDYSVLVYECLSQSEILAIPSPDKPSEFCSRLDLSQQTMTFRVNYQQSLPPDVVLNRACSQRGKEVLEASQERVDHYISWAKTGKPVPVDISALKKSMCIAQIRPYQRLKVLSMDDIQKGDHLIEARLTHWFHFMVTECKIDPTNPNKIKAIYCLRTSIREEKITIDPTKKDIYKIDYPESFSAKSAIERARSTKKRQLSPLARQWFIRWAKTGSEEGIEVEFLTNNAFPASKSKIRTFAQLNPGDYFVGGEDSKMKPSPWHHYLVTGILTPTKCSAIESWNGIIKVSEVTLDQSNIYYRLNYNDGACITPECAIADAVKLVGRVAVKPKYQRQKFVNFIKTREELISGPLVSLDTLYDDRLFLHRERIQSAKYLKKGDHVERPVDSSVIQTASPGGELYHHMMVVEPIDERKCKVLHFSKEGQKLSVKEEDEDVFKVGMEVFRIDYQERRHPADGINELRKFVGQQLEKGYNVFTNNCEHLLMRATVGVDTSIQIDEKMHKALQYSKRALISGLGNVIGFSTTRGTVKGALKAGVKVTAKCGHKLAAKAGTRVGAQIVTPKGALVRVATFRLGYTAALDATAIGLVAGISVAANLLIEAPFFARGVYKLRRKQQFECISDTEFKQGVTKQVFASANTVIGAVSGAVAGQILIPVPVVGAAIGGAVGSMAGQAAGAAEGWLASKILFKTRTVDLPLVVNYKFSDCM